VCFLSLTVVDLSSLSCLAPGAAAGRDAVRARRARRLWELRRSLLLAAGAPPVAGPWGDATPERLRRRADEHGMDSNPLDRVRVQGEIQVLRKEKTLVKFAKS